MTTTTTPSARQTVERERKERIAAWFKDHRATLRTFTAPDGRTIEMLTWAKPGTRMYRVDYLCDGPHLIVTGDLDDAIYEAGADDMRWWATCSLDYFHGKCIASPSGRRPEDWDERIAREGIRFYLDEMDEHQADERRAAWAEYGGDDALHSQADWNEWLRDYASDVFGPNWTDCEMWDVGAIIEQSCEAHLTGLKLAMAQLASVEVAPHA